MFDIEGYNLGLSLDIYEYQRVVWTDYKRSIYEYQHAFAAHTFCETIVHLKEEVVDLIVMMVHNKGVRLTAEE
jgi:hypothetical protein